jgi:hypothetical protein
MLEIGKSPAGVNLPFSLQWTGAFWSRTGPRPAAVAATSDFCGGLLNRLTGGLSYLARDPY